MAGAREAPGARQAAVVRMQLEGASPKAEMLGEQE
jgi:hypothetical protein